MPIWGWQKKKIIEEAMKITRADVAENLGGLPPIKMHCSNLAADALHEAIKDYQKKKTAKNSHYKLSKSLHY